LDKYIKIKTKIVNIIEEIYLNKHTIINELIELYIMIDYSIYTCDNIIKNYYDDFIKIIII